MPVKKQIQKTNNIVKIQDSKKERDYIYSTAIRMRPRIFDEYGCILWQVTPNMIFFAKKFLFENCVKYWGLEIEEDDNGEEFTPIKERATGESGGGFNIDLYQVKLIKIPPIKFIK